MPISRHILFLLPSLSLVVIGFGDVWLGGANGRTSVTRSPPTWGRACPEFGRLVWGKSLSIKQ